jgi:Antibiotic biosynthesis monooxygenase
MPGEIMTEVSAVVAGERAGEVLAAFAELAQRPLPEGLLRTELLEGGDGRWKIQSLWRDRAALDAMRAGSEPPAAPALFRRLGAEPELRIYILQARHTVLP